MNAVTSCSFKRRWVRQGVRRHKSQLDSHVCTRYYRPRMFEVAGENIEKKSRRGNEDCGRSAGAGCVPISESEALPLRRRRVGGECTIIGKISHTAKVSVTFNQLNWVKLSEFCAVARSSSLTVLTTPVAVQKSLFSSLPTRAFSTIPPLSRSHVHPRNPY